MTNKQAQVLHYDLYGRREDKYEFLNNNSISTINWNELSPEEPYNFFVPKDFDNANEYENGFKIDEMFKVYNSGVKTDRDSLFIDEEKENIISRFKILLSGNYSDDFKIKFRVEDSGSFKLSLRISNKIFNNKYVKLLHYRPFDFKWIYYDENIISRPAYQVFKNLTINNIILNTSRTLSPNLNWNRVFLTKNLTDVHTIGDQNYCYPLYLYHEPSGQQSDEQTAERTPNLKMEIVDRIAEGLGLTFTSEPFDYAQGDTHITIAPIDILDYIYAVLHSPTYREKYKEFLKIDFPRVPYPKDKETFWKLVNLGGQLRQIHLLESPITENYITQYPIDGNNEVAKIRFDSAQRDSLGKVYINDTQYFDNVPLIAWNFYIGGYQPAQKWLKDRKGRTLDYDDIFHYQKIIVALTETDRIMKEIDCVKFMEGE